MGADSALAKAVRCQAEVKAFEPHSWLFMLFQHLSSYNSLVFTSLWFVICEDIAFFFFLQNCSGVS